MLLSMVQQLSLVGCIVSGATAPPYLISDINKTPPNTAWIGVDLAVNAARPGNGDYVITADKGEKSIRVHVANNVCTKLDPNPSAQDIVLVPLGATAPLNYVFVSNVKVQILTGPLSGQTLTYDIYRKQ